MNKHGKKLVLLPAVGSLMFRLSSPLKERLLTLRSLPVRGG